MKFYSGELDNPAEYLQLCARSELLKLETSSEKDDDEEKGDNRNLLNLFDDTVTLQGQKLLLLHLMKEALDDNSGFLSSNVSVVKDGSNLEEPTSDQQQLDLSASGMENNDVEDDCDDGGAHDTQDKELSTERPKYQSFQNRSMEAIKTHCRYGTIGDNTDDLPAKRCRRSVKELDDEKPAATAKSIAKAKPSAAKAKPSAKAKPAVTKAKPIAVTTKNAVVTAMSASATKSKVVAKTKATTAAMPASVANSKKRSKEGEVKIKVEEEEEEESEAAHSTRGSKRKAPAVKESTSSAAIIDKELLLATQQRAHAKQIAEMKSENEKLLKALVQNQSKMITEAITKITDEQAKGLFFIFR